MSTRFILTLFFAAGAVLAAEADARAGRFKTAANAEVVPAPAGVNSAGVDPLTKLIGSEDGVQSIGQLTTDIRIKEVREGKPAGDVPPDVAAQVLNDKPVYANGREQRGWMQLCFHWEASNLFSQPLYFEDWNLERYGYSPKGFRVLQPALSAGRFYLTVVTLPYQMAVHPAREPVYTLGYYRPGSPAPYRFSRPELRPAAGVVATGFWIGLLLLIQ